METRYFILFLAVLLALSAGFSPSLRKATEGARTRYSANQTDADLQERNQSAFAQILGEVRATMADLLFMKTGAYLHAGVGYAPKLKLDSADDRKAFSACAPGTPTLIPVADKDFRGFLGRLEREVKPFRDPSQNHVHTTATELIPWFRVMTLTDPHYVRGYRVGSKTLADAGKWKEGLDFLNEGIANNRENPDLFLLYQSLATLGLRGRIDATCPWHNDWRPRTLDAARKAFELGKKERSPLGEDGKMGRNLLWTADIEEDFRFSAHMIPLILRDQGQLEEALKVAQEIHALAPHYKPGRDLLDEINAKLSESTSGEGKGTR